jgi:hypothetical protein
MSRINKYQEGIQKFLKNKSFIKDTTKTTQNIINEVLETSDHLPAILCLTILNNQCKKYEIRIHGYYIASGIDVLMIVARVCNNRDYFNNKYTEIAVDNMIFESTNCFYKCITQNIEILRDTKDGEIHKRLTQLCIEYATKIIPHITFKQKIFSNDKMKKTDLFCMSNVNDFYNEYKKKNKLNENIIFADSNKTYGSVCKLALTLGWIIGLGDDTCLNKIKELSDDKNISNLEKLADDIGYFLKIYDDFKYILRDIKIGQYSMNYVINYGIKQSYIKLIETKTKFLEGIMNLKIETKTMKEIIDFIMDNVDEIIKDVSVDMETQYDDVSLCI